jgi:hypothetical protein
MARSNLCLCFLLALSGAVLSAQDTTTTKQSAGAKSRADSIQQTAGRDSLPGATPPSQPALAQEKSTDGVDWTAVATLVAFAGLLFGLYQYWMRHRDKAKEEYHRRRGEQQFDLEKREKIMLTAEERYRHTLQDELGSIRMLGSPEIENLPVKLLDAFVSLDVSETWRSETRFAPDKMAREESQQRSFPPEKVLQRAFQRYRALLIIGDPGSGKTTLLKYYAMCCLDAEGYHKRGFAKPVLPIYFPLRDLESEKSLPENLAQWAKDRVLDISAQDFQCSQVQTAVAIVAKVTSGEFTATACQLGGTCATG